MAYDRDEDGARDGDERDAGDDPADRPTFAIPAMAVPPPDAPAPDAGPPDLDGGPGRFDVGVSPLPDGGSTPRGSGGCGCRAAGSPRSVPWALLLVAAVGAGIRRRRDR